MSETSDAEELFDHCVAAWTVGRLREALEGVPDDLPVTVFAAEEPGGELLQPEQVVVSAWAWASVEAASADEMRARIAAGQVRPDHFEIGTEFPSGQYYRRRRS